MEIWDLYDKEGRRTGQTWERSFGGYKQIPDGYYHMVVDILVQHVDGSFLLTKRDTSKDVYPGYWEASAGGSAIKGEEPEDAAKRELFEETGLTAISMKLVSRTFRDPSHSMFYSFLATVDADKDSVVLQEGETVDYKWVDDRGFIDYVESDLAIKTHNDRYKDVIERIKAGMKIKIAYVQLLPGKDIVENLEIGKKACVEAKEAGADIVLFPEMWSDGYYLPQDEDELRNLSISKDSGFINEFRELAAKLQIAVCITFLETNEPRPLNSVVFFDRYGKEILHYSKVHTCAFDDEAVLSEGDDFYVTDLDYGKGTVKVGAMICFDREFPESARILMLKGVELILAPNACPMEINRLSALRTRAYENMVAVATCNYPEGHPDCNGHSTLFDGVPWNKETGSRDMCVFEAPGTPGVYVAQLDLDELRTHRSGDIMGDKYRHPDKYAILSDPEVRDVIGGEFVHW